MGADLDWRDVTVLRSIGRYLRQVGITYSQSYFAQALSSNVDIARQLIQLSGLVSIPSPVSTSRLARRRRTSSSPRSRRRSTMWPALIMIES